MGRELNVSESFMSEIRLFSFNLVPRGWASCDGQTLAINQNQALFSLLGTTYGGDGRTTFALPDLRARVPIHVGNGHPLGESGGEAAHTLTTGELGVHAHQVNASSVAGNDVGNAPGPLVLASPLNQTYRPASALGAMAPTSLTNFVGGAQPHNNRQPYLALAFCICLQGIFPSRN
jgi:microcystin-dependent protein